MQPVLHTSTWSSFAAFAPVKLHVDRQRLSHEQIELDTSVFYIGLGDQFDDDRRRIRPT